MIFFKYALFIFWIFSLHTETLLATVVIHTSDRDIFIEKEILEKHDYFRAMFSSQMKETQTLEIDWRTDNGSAVEILMDFIKYGSIKEIDPHTLHICRDIAHRIFLDSFLEQEKKIYFIHQPLFQNTNSEPFFTGKCVVCLQPISALSFYLHYQVHHDLDIHKQDESFFSKEDENSNFFIPKFCFSTLSKNIKRIIPLKVSLSLQAIKNVEKNLLTYSDHTCHDDAPTRS